MELTPQQISILERLQNSGFHIVAYPMYANYIGVRKSNCAALLAPVVGNYFQLHGQPSYLLGGNFTVRITKDGRDWFVWKKEKVEVTSALLGELSAFTVELTDLLLPRE